MTLADFKSVGVAAFAGTGGFDSHTLPPTYTNRGQASQCFQGFPDFGFSPVVSRIRPQFVREFARREVGAGSPAAVRRHRVALDLGFRGRDKVHDGGAIGRKHVIQISHGTSSASVGNRPE